MTKKDEEEGGEEVKKEVGYAPNFLEKVTDWVLQGPVHIPASIASSVVRVSMLC